MVFEIFKDFFEKWVRVLTEPKKAFAEEKANASLRKAIEMMLVAGVIAGIFNLITYCLSHSYGGFFEIYSYLSGALMIVPGVIFTIIIFLILSGTYYIFAKLLKGTGNFTSQTYLFALSSAPYVIITAALKMSPKIEAFLIYPVLAYGLYLLTLSLKEVHQYSTGKAILTLLIPFVILFVIVFVIAVIAAIWFVSMINSIFGST